MACTPQSVCEGVMADGVENIVQVSITKIHPSSVIHWASYLRIEGYHFG